MPKRNLGYASVDTILNKHVLNYMFKIEKSIKECEMVTVKGRLEKIE